MATIKAIEARSVHQIQSGQVIVDLCSVAKELVENSLDAGATSVEVRFKNHGLDAIEVQDNGSGIAPANYENVALKHYTSKLSGYEDLSSLQTFGFRGEALSSLCALSKFSITTAQADEAPKGKRLEFDVLGKLKSTTVVAAQKGTTATVENLFDSLPVRRKELTKNVKREYGKVLGLLHAYACISVNVKFTVKNAMPKGKGMTVFSTKGNATTRENIANVYGAKTLTALISLDLDLDFQPTLGQMTRKDPGNTKIRVKGHISRPVFGEGRQTPDRQMFFVNGRPCGLPQISKSINEVYKAFNVSQSPFIFADLQMDTNAYDVNVSPDKRTILLHDSAALIENLKTALNDMFDQQDQTMPQSQLQTPKLPAFQKLNLQRQVSSGSPDAESRRTSLSGNSALRDESEEGDVPGSDHEDGGNSLLREHFRSFASTREKSEFDVKMQEKLPKAQGKRDEKITHKMAEEEDKTGGTDEYDDSRENAEAKEPEEEEELSQHDSVKIHVRDFNARMAGWQSKSTEPHASRSEVGPRSPEVQSVVPLPNVKEKGIVPDAFDRMRPKRMPAELATVTIGDRTITTILGSQFPRSQERSERPVEQGSASEAAKPGRSAAAFQFSQKLRKFGAPGVEISDDEVVEDQNDQDAAPQSDSEENEERDSEQAEGPEDESVAEDAVEEESGNEESISDRDVDNASDTDYLDEAEKKKEEEARVAELIRAAEERSHVPTQENLKRATKALAGGRVKDSTTNLQARVKFSVASAAREMRRHLDLANEEIEARDLQASNGDNSPQQDPETRLSLTVSKPDFAKMRIVGQFNLGFILAVRSGRNKHDSDELFIIDQHASDEKYNFEKLQAETVVGNQRLVRPVMLDLTAVEEEIALEHHEALEKNGFLVEIDTSGDRMVGQRCSLVSLPLSKEVVFNIRDLEELIQLLADSPGLGGESGIPRPSKVRKMFAMRACRSSIMIGKTLSRKQMEQVVAHMGTIDKPWNCPHGRPTMRHLCSLNTLEPWREGREEHGEDQDQDQDQVQVQGQRQLGLGEALQRYAGAGG